VRHFALSAIGRNRPGIAAQVSAVLLDHGLNVEDSQMTILGGHFAMMLIVAAPDGVERERLAADLDGAATRLSLEALTLRDVGDLGRTVQEPSHAVAVFGPDHPGILHGTTAALADLGVDVTDLNTRLVEEDGDSLYVMLLEVALPEELEPDELERTLDEVGHRENVEITLRELED
jgi:glycine cleavage system transcriptional repressor